MIVVDASALIEVLLRTRRCQAIAARLFDPAESLHAPHLIDVEVAHVLRRYERTGEISAQRGGEALSDLADFPLVRHGHDTLLPRMWGLRDNLTAYDAAYVALAEALGAPLLSCDRKLMSAAQHGAQIELY